MTKSTYKNKSAFIITKSIFVFLIFIFLSVFASDSISRHVLSGLKFSVNVILPTVFPFMVFSDFASHSFEFEKSKILSSGFERLFKINASGISAFLSGIVGGFPVGAKNALLLFENGKISKCECERLMCFSNLPSPAYVISAIGIEIIGSFKTGIILYLTVLLSAAITGKRTFIQNQGINNKQNYDFVLSLKSSASASVNVIFFISFFSGLCGLIKSLPIANIAKIFMISLSEVGNAVLYISDLCILSPRFSLAMIAFSLSFSGISVIMQSLAISEKKEISIAKCVLYKLLQGSISFIIILLLPL